MELATAWLYSTLMLLTIFSMVYIFLSAFSYRSCMSDIPSLHFSKLVARMLAFASKLLIWKSGWQLLCHFWYS